jgi:hypothetical protein
MASTVPHAPSERLSTGTPNGCAVAGSFRPSVPNRRLVRALGGVGTSGIGAPGCRLLAQVSDADVGPVTSWLTQTAELLHPGQP